MRGDSHFSPFRAPPSKNRFVNRLSTSRLAGWHYTQGVKTLRVKPERLASIRLCRERCPVASKDVQGSARHCKVVEVSGKAFFVSFRGVEVQTRPCPTFGRPVHLEDCPHRLRPVTLLMPFGFHLVMDTLPSGVRQ